MDFGASTPPGNRLPWEADQGIRGFQCEGDFPRSVGTSGGDEE